MRALGILLLCIGIVWAYAAFNMETTVTTKSEIVGTGEYSVQVPSMTVHNIGLLDRRRSHLMFSGLSALLGVILIAFSRAPQNGGDVELRPCPKCAEKIQLAAVKCRYCHSDVTAQAAQVSGGGGSYFDFRGFIIMLGIVVAVLLLLGFLAT